ncbi:DNA polymerase III subunit delta [Bacillus sp. BP-3]|uniref:DNA polymerase III subunit delta n=1 Tax=Bacillus sp. BP-3 TaxID=3022773 RepID=UPI00232F602F|nr:DNA polymerase III subunit delta [Bacillus sp. BP-3]MDC2863452.1 DNA polymerase III subunit delta [Bacillus sp. BP-3]
MLGKGGCKLKKRMICFVFSSMVLSACSFQQTMVEEKKFAESLEANEDMMSDPMPVQSVKNVLPFSFYTPSFLPYDSTDNPKAVVRKMGDKRIALDIKYERQEKGMRDYIELTVANFSYNFPYIVEQNRFQEKVRLANGIIAYFKNSNEEMDGEDMATLTWKEKNVEYQLLYRNVRDQDSEDVKKNLVYIASKMQ